MPLLHQSLLVHQCVLCLFLGDLKVSVALRLYRNPLRLPLVALRMGLAQVAQFEQVVQVPEMELS